MCINPYRYSKLSGYNKIRIDPITYIRYFIPHLKVNKRSKQFYKIQNCSNYSNYKYINIPNKKYE